MRNIQSIILLNFVVAGFPAYGAGTASFEAALTRGRSPIVVENSYTEQKRQRGWSALGPAVIEEGAPVDGDRSSRWVFDTNSSPRFDKADIKDTFLTYLKNQSDFSQIIPRLYTSGMVLQNLTEHVTVLTIPIRFNGIEVQQGYVEATFANSGNQYALRSLQDHSFIDAEISGSEIEDIDLAQIKTATGMPALTVDEHQVILYPVLSDDGTTTLHYAGQYKLLDQSTKINYTVIFSNESHEILEAFKHQLSNEYVLQGEVYQRNYLDGQKILVPLARTPINLNGDAKTTDPRGVFSANALGNAVIGTKSTIASIIDTSTNQAVNLTRALQDLAQVSASDNELRALNAFTAVQRINRYTKRFLLASESSYLTRQLNVKINVSGSCNSFYDGTVNLFAAGGGCANMALVNDVIFHEWGHGLDDYTGRRLGITDGAFSEGIGDIVSSYYSGSSMMGAGFNQGSSAGIRQLNNTKKYPTNVVGEVHDDGLIIGGAFWDLRVALIARYGEAKGAHIAADLFFKHLRLAETYRESYQLVLDVDDDDGNPATQSPNFCLISAAFAKHGLSTQAPCDDVVPPNSYPVDKDLALNFVETSGTNTKFAVSTLNSDARGGWICLGTSVNCAENTRTALAIEGKDATHLFLVTGATVAFAEHTTIAVAVVDGNKQVVGTRTFKLASQ